MVFGQGRGCWCEDIDGGIRGGEVTGMRVLRRDWWRCK